MYNKVVKLVDVMIFKKPKSMSYELCALLFSLCINK